MTTLELRRFKFLVDLDKKLSEREENPLHVELLVYLFYKMEVGAEAMVTVLDVQTGFNLSSDKARGLLKSLKEKGWVELTRPNGKHVYALNLKRANEIRAQ